MGVLKIEKGKKLQRVKAMKGMIEALLPHLRAFVF